MRSVKGDEPTLAQQLRRGLPWATKRLLLEAADALESRDQRIEEAFANHRWNYGASRTDCSCGENFVDAVPSVWSAYLDHLLKEALAGHGRLFATIEVRDQRIKRLVAVASAAGPTFHRFVGVDPYRLQDALDALRPGDLDG